MDGLAGEAPNLELLLFGWVDRGGQGLSEDWPRLVAEDLPHIDFIGLEGPAEAEEDHFARLNPG